MKKLFLPSAIAGVSIVVLASMPLIGAGRDAGPGEEQPTGCRSSAVPPDPSKPQIDCAAPPDTFDVSAFFSSDSSPDARGLAGPTFDSWAWAAFAALNWPAQEAADASAYPTGYRRGVPDLARSFAGAANDDVLVWETFKEKRELFQPTDTPAKDRVDRTSRWQAITFDPGQQPVGPDNSDGIPPCTAPHAERAAELLAQRGHHRIFFQGRKHPTAGGTQTLDEVVQVASQARETAAVLCAGYDAKTNPTLEYCLQTLFPEDPANPMENELLLSARTPVGPRVWRGNPKDLTTARPVLFEVKVNYDFWRYILDHDLQIDTVSTQAALSTSADERPLLPYRSSAAKGPGRSPAAVFGYDADAAIAGYRRLADPDVLPGVGSVQAKAAWLQLSPAEVASGKFHTTEAIFYRSPDPKDLDRLCYEVDTFGLLGLHIIQRVHSARFDRRNPGLFAPGGSFVFATWEHTSLTTEPSGYYYANYFAFPGPVTALFKYPFTTDVTPFPNFHRAPNGAIPVVREMPYPLATTSRVNDAVHDQLGAGSVWRNYRLIGTQFLPVGSEAESMAFNQPYYLANLLVETNDGLQKFQGLPPGVSAVSGTPMRGNLTPYYTQKVDVRGTAALFERDYANVVFNRELRNPVNMGGCMGCHGVAQLKGFNFSFVFLDGQAGSGIDTQHHFVVAGGDLDPDDD
jgi:hypothetical protein